LEFFYFVADLAGPPHLLHRFIPYLVVPAHKRFKNQRSQGKPIIYVRYRTDRVQFYVYHFNQAMGDIIPRFGYG